MIRQLKDAALAKGVKAAVNMQMKAYGSVESLELDSEAKRVLLRLMLEGEHEVLEVDVERYEIYEISGVFYVRVEGVRTSRVWLNALAQKHLEGRAWQIPAKYAKIIKKLL